jgi:hypothetical protein
LDSSNINGALGSCVLIGVTDPKLTDNAIYGCNLSSNPIGTNDAAVEFTALSRNGVMTGNNLCTKFDLGFTPNQIGVLFGANTSRFTLANNTYFECTQNQVNNSTTAFSVYEVSQNPPPSIGTLGGITGLGSLGTAQFYQGNEFGGEILLVPNGTGITTSGGLTINLLQPLYPQALCFLQAVTGAGGVWTPSLGSNGASPTTYQITWSGVAFSAGAVFTGSISGTTLNVTAVSSGVVSLNHTVQGAGVPMGEQILSQLSGTTGGVGTYSLGTTAAVSSEAMNSAAGYFLQYHCGGF